MTERRDRGARTPNRAPFYELEEEVGVDQYRPERRPRRAYPAPRRSGRRRRHMEQLVVVLVILVAALLCLGRILLPPRVKDEQTGGGQIGDVQDGGTDTDQGGGFITLDEDEQKLREILSQPDRYPQALRELAEKNPEALDYVYQYPELHQQTPDIDLSAEAASGEVPLLLQWDTRWGYRSYGSGLIGYTGCGPTCMSMVAIYLTGNADYDPAAVAEYAQAQGYYAEGSGTDWEFMNQGCAGFGLQSEVLPLDEGRMTTSLDEGRPLICAMGPGDFTDNGHFIVVTGYTGQGFTIRDPNSPRRSAQVWSFDQLSGQIKNIWAFSKA